MSLGCEHLILSLLYFFLNFLKKYPHCNQCTCVLFEGGLVVVDIDTLTGVRLFREFQGAGDVG